MVLSTEAPRCQLDVV
ncbi:rCG26483 [Rattus norvegicus]|uniref:RCG26483 n=1 Tax=Rattus norvegicus TaxID=10116 RepID=A6HMN9_RAT|nr:rCG26483 [Rattus norvegicus]